VPAEYTDTISQVQGQRGILELTFPYPGKYMFHAHKTEFAELGWMGFFEVEDQ
jgi:FtsP/CotA-like multicopper oxidase with cupredoxin domain